MFRLYGFPTQNSLKPLYVLAAVDCEYEFEFVDLSKGEHKREAFGEKTPIGKVPVLEHDGEHIFESGAICRYVASATESPLYPVDTLQRARVDQWMDFFSCHLGRYLSAMFFEKVIKRKFKLGEPNQESIEEATRFVNEQFAILNNHLENSDWLANDTLSIADLFAFAYVEQHRAIDFSLQDFPNAQAWFERVAALESIANAKSRLPA